MESNLTLDSLIHIFSFLPDSDLINASFVCKIDSLQCDHDHTQGGTRKMSAIVLALKTSFVNPLAGPPEAPHVRSPPNIGSVTSPTRAKLCGEGTQHPCDASMLCRITGLVYMVENSHNSEYWNTSPVVCSASTDGTVRAWDVQQGVQLWSSPAQNPVSDIIIDTQEQVIFTADSAGLVKAWVGRTGREMASFPTSASKCKLLTCSIGDQSAVFVGTAGGALYLLSSPSMSLMSRHVLFDGFNLNVLVSSPDETWILVGTTEGFDCYPKVFSSQSLRCPTDDDPVLSQSLPVFGCIAAVFLPFEPARVAVVHGDELTQKKTLSVFEVAIKKSTYNVEVRVQQVESFQLESAEQHSDIILQARSASTVVVGLGRSLRVYSVKGTVLATFEDHTQPITALCVDGFRVVTASRDLSLRVLTWKKEKNSGVSLESRFHLLGGSHLRSRGFTYVVCDYASIVASVESIDGNDVLKAYSFQS